MVFIGFSAKLAGPVLGWRKRYQLFSSLLRTQHQTSKGLLKTLRPSVRLSIIRNPNSGGRPPNLFWLKAPDHLRARWVLRSSRPKLSYLLASAIPYSAGTPTMLGAGQSQASREEATDCPGHFSSLPTSHTLIWSSLIFASNCRLQHQ